MTALPHSGKRKKAVVQQTYQHAYEAVAFFLELPLYNIFGNTHMWNLAAYGGCRYGT